MFRFAQLCCIDFSGTIATLPKFLDPLRVDVEADRGAGFSELDGKGKTDIAQPYDSHFLIHQREWHGVSFAG